MMRGASRCEEPRTPVVASAPAARTAMVAAPSRGFRMSELLGWIGDACLCAASPGAVVNLAATAVQRRGNEPLLTSPGSIHRGRDMKALVFGGPGQRSWDNVEDPGIQEPT